jgi:hypothetical protein
VPLSLGRRVVLSDAGGVLVETYARTETGWRSTDTVVDATASLVRRVLMDDCSGDTVTMCGYSAAAFGTSGWRLQWGTVGEPSTDTPARPDTLAGFTIRRTLLELERHEHQPDGRFAARGQAVADALGYNEPLSAAIRIIQRCPWRPEVKNFAWELTTGCALIGRRGGANTDDCATCAAVEAANEDSVLHILCGCEATTALRQWANTVIGELYSGRDGCDPCLASPTGFGSFLAYGGGSDIGAHPAMLAIRGACLHALRTTRAEAHAALDDHDDTAARRRETDDTDTVLGVLPAAPTTFVTKGWSTERLIAAAVRDLRAHIVCDFHVASGAYSVHPDHVGYATLRPTNMAEFDALWGAICSTNGANGRGCPVPAFSDSLTVNRRT